VVNDKRTTHKGPASQLILPKLAASISVYYVLKASRSMSILALRVLILVFYLYLA